jgi:hypothetical protein
VLVDDIPHVAINLRPLDLDEVRASRGDGVDVEELLARSVGLSALAWTYEVDGEPAALFGVVPSAHGYGVPWLLGTPATTRYPSEFWRHSVPAVRRMTEAFALLANYVDARNRPSIRYLRRLGFTIHPAEPWGVAGRPFHPFTLETGYV